MNFNHARPDASVTSERLQEIALARAVSAGLTTHSAAARAQGAGNTPRFEQRFPQPDVAVHGGHSWKVYVKLAALAPNGGVATAVTTRGTALRPFASRSTVVDGAASEVPSTVSGRIAATLDATALKGGVTVQP